MLTLIALLMIPGACRADITLYEDRALFEAAGCIAENYGYEDWPPGVFSYPPNPWTIHGITYRTGDNLIAGAGVAPFYPLSNVFLYNGWSPILADVDPAPQYTMMGGEFVDVTTNPPPVLFSIVVHTNLDTYVVPDLSVPLASESIGQFYGVITDPGEYVTGFEIHSGGSPHGAGLDNATLGHAGGPSPTESTTWGGIKALFQ
jgi:hypothetical protein